MDLKQLRSFLHIAELSSLSKAAERLHLSQPALSRQIKMLEAEIGEPLFLRTGRGVEITEAGRLLERRANAVLTELERFNSDLAAQKGRVAGTLCLGLPPSSGLILAGPLIERYRSEYPDVRLRVTQLLSGTLQEHLLDGRADLGILYEGATSPRIAFERLNSEELFLIARPQEISAPKNEVNFDSLCSMPLILPGQPHSLRTIVERLAAKRDQKLNVVIEADSLSVLLELVRRGLGVTILSQAACRRDVEKRRLIALPITDPGIVRTAVLAWSRDFPLTPAAKAMSAHIHQAIS
jgi:LysR family nitrogen assimilation transcriptional regulator